MDKACVTCAVRSRCKRVCEHCIYCLPDDAKKGRQEPLCYLRLSKCAKPTYRYEHRKMKGLDSEAPTVTVPVCVGISPAARPVKLWDSCEGFRCLQRKARG